MTLYAAGQKVRAAELNTLPQMYRATAPTFSPNSTTLKDIIGLAFQADASALYLVEGYLAYHASSGADLKLAWSLPSDYVPGNGAAGTGSWWAAAGLNLGASTSTAVGDLDAVVNDSLTVIHQRAGNDGAPAFCYVAASILMGPTAGTCKLQFAQLNATAHNTTIRAGSCLRVTKMS